MREVHYQNHPWSLKIATRSLDRGMAGKQSLLMTLLVLTLVDAQYTNNGEFSRAVNYSLVSTSSVYVVQSQSPEVPPPSTQPPPPASQHMSVSSLVIGLTSTLVVLLVLLIASVVINVHLLRLLPLGILPAWVQGKPAPTQHQVVGLKEVSTVPQGTARNVDDTESWPELRPRPYETFATASAVPSEAPKGNYVPKDDPDNDYITAQDVKPVEVEILKQQNLIQGQICYATSPKPSLPFGSAHR